MEILRFAAVAGALMLVACQRDPTLVELSGRDVSVHAVLIAGEDSAHVLVVRPSVSDINRGLPNPVTNAEVRLIAPNQTVLLVRGGQCLSLAGYGIEPENTNDGCYSAALPGGIIAGEQYQLEIDVPGMPMIRGSTQVPASPSIQSPVANAELPVAVRPDTVSTFVVSWSGVRADAPVTIHLHTDPTACVIGFREGEMFTLFSLRPWIPARGTEPVSVEALYFNCAQPPDRIELPLVVTVFDDNYDSYTRDRDTSVPWEDASAGLTGAFGVFGSAARSAVPIALVRQ